MDKQAANRLIDEVFNSKFDRTLYRRFITELVNQFEPKENRWAGNVIPDAYKDHIRQYERLGTYTDPDGEEIELLMVNLRKETALDRARTMQRNFVAHHLKTRGEREAALVAYYHEDQADWRFSLVRMDYRAVQDEESGRVKIQEELTPARRYSFLVGADEPNHTAQSQLHAFLLEDRRNPTLAQLEDAFNIESVTKEFFGKYKELFLDLQDELDRVAKQDAAVRNEFIRCEIDTATFAKKLLGQIVFLYFLQKKGWMGVAPEANWGDGSRTFMRRLFDGKYGSYGNFFNDLLEPLFYNALAVERPGDLYAPLNCKIPFLNGGLFEPTGGYDWRATDILIRNQVFADIFAAFDLYNFTVREDEPLEKEVAVDPEMLGKVFENLLEVTDRKSKGAFYTPREIVHYMCQESLINYLDTAVNLREVPVGGEEMAQSSMFAEPTRQAKLTTTEYAPIVPRDDIAVLVRLGELAIEHDTAKETGTKSHKHRLPQSVREHAAAIDEALASIKICDPAIGSGAFPVGMMHEIVRAREVLTTYLGDSGRTTYDLKRHAIQESIYGVDIDPSAVDIAKLRLWLSLVVDEESYQSIQPLPNLDYKIVQGNSLLKVEKNLFNERLFADLDALKRRYFHETHGQEKLKLRAQIDILISQLTNGQRDFDFEIYFHEVFDANGGFDVVIGNPPYVRHERFTSAKPQLKTDFSNIYTGTADLYVYFYAQGMSILRQRGILAFITSNKFMHAGYGKKLRGFLTTETTLHSVIDFGDLPVFDATAYPAIVIVEKRKPAKEALLLALTVKSLDVLEALPLAAEKSGWPMPQTALRLDSWSLVRTEVLELMEKLRSRGTPLAEYVGEKFYRGVVTGCNQAFVIDDAKRAKLINADPRSAEVIKPWLRGRDVKRWHAEWKKLYLIFTRRGVDIDEYPAIQDYLSQFKAQLMPKPVDWPERKSWPGRKPGNYEWYEIQDSTAYYSEFAKAKIISTDIAKRCEFTLDDSSAFIDATLFCIPIADLFLLAMLNSAVVEFFYRTISSSIRGDYLRFKRLYLFSVPIPSDPNPRSLAHVQSIIRNLLEAPKSGQEVMRWERELNFITYQLYDLTPDEIALIEAEIGSSSS